MSDNMTNSIESPAGRSRRNLLGGMGAAAAGAGILALAGTQTAEAATSNGSYYTFGPYRHIDTRNGFGGRIYAGQTRTYTNFTSGTAGYTMVFNLTVVYTSGSGYLAIYNADIARPNPYSTINWQGSGRLVANLALVDIGAAGYKVYCGGVAGSNTHFILDSIGYLYTNVAAKNAAQKAWEKEMKARLDRGHDR